MSSTTAARARRRSTRHQRAWYWYDWANSAYVTTTATVLMGPYLTSIANRAACPGQPVTQVCRTDLSVLGVPVSPGSLYPYVTTVTTVLSAVLLVAVGAVADRSAAPQRLLGWFAAVGAAAAAAMVFVQGTGWQLGVALLMVASLCLGCTLVIYDGILCRIAGPDDRDRVSSRGWALGYVGGALLLAANFGLLTVHDRLGLTTDQAVRISLLSAGLWWGVFTLIPVLGLRDLPPQPLPDDLPPDAGPRAGTVGGAFAQLRDTLTELRGYPQTLLFLLAYLFFNDGIQTVISASSLFGSSELGMAQSQVLLTFLVVQVVAVGGALGFGRLAARFGAHRTVLASLVVWTVVVAVAFVVPRGSFPAFVALGVLIGVVLGGTQALSRSLYSQLVPRGRESEFFSLYQAMERGTSWFGTLLFGLMQQWTHSYRLSIVALVVFFVVGGVLLSKVDVRAGIRAAGNAQPAVV
ncbi:MFS transporter [Arsenicicoccus sp. oral taxon 190]|uniref:MFS transporter n=1 Tax=Arsenicicoccus sp. oral taxon 190 TaxID=1658671 RepID=UPI000679EBA4|nr:MFS transporter [Arsenicicoccus sp. oral taxon 190]AKT51886.1 MFS transporter [Arsenicicoccus sp. oral taxon 190]